MSHVPTVVPEKKGLLHVDENSMRTNSVEQVSSMLTSVTLFVGVATLLLLIVFVMSMKWERKQEIPFIEERLAGRGDHAAGFERDMDPPGADEVQQLSEPAMEQTMQMVTDAISSIAASLDSVNSGMAASGEGTGKGDSRPPGPEGEGEIGVQRGERWDLKFIARDKKAYAQQLDAFGIELGAIGGGIPHIDYAFNLSKTPTKRSGTRDQEKRLFFMHTSNNALQQYDRQLLGSAGVPLDDRQLLKFIPKDVENQIAVAEQAYYLEKRSKQFRVSDIAKTIFECRPAKSGKYEWTVIDQRYRGKNPNAK